LLITFQFPGDQKKTIQGYLEINTLTMHTHYMLFYKWKEVFKIRLTS